MPLNSSSRQQYDHPLEISIGYNGVLTFGWEWCHWRLKDCWDYWTKIQATAFRYIKFFTSAKEISLFLQTNILRCFWFFSRFPILRQRVIIFKAFELTLMKFKPIYEIYVKMGTVRGIEMQDHIDPAWNNSLIVITHNVIRIIVMNQNNQKGYISTWSS